VPAALAEYLGWPLVTLAANVQIVDSEGPAVRVVNSRREVVEAILPAVVTVSNELGRARYPTTRGMLNARRQNATVLNSHELLASSPSRGVEIAKLFVPDVQGHCEFITGESTRSQAQALFDRLRAVGVVGDS
jgi:electron transfer flavoprotein beta subunit